MTKSKITLPRTLRDHTDRFDFQDSEYPLNGLFGLLLGVTVMILLGVMLSSPSALYLEYETPSGIKLWIPRACPKEYVAQVSISETFGNGTYPVHIKPNGPLPCGGKRAVLLFPQRLVGTCEFSLDLHRSDGYGYCVPTFIWGGYVGAFLDYL